MRRVHGGLAQSKGPVRSTLTWRICRLLQYILEGHLAVAESFCGESLRLCLYRVSAACLTEALLVQRVRRAEQPERAQRRSCVLGAPPRARHSPGAFRMSQSCMHMQMSRKFCSVIDNFAWCHIMKHVCILCVSKFAICIHTPSCEQSSDGGGDLPCAWLLGVEPRSSSQGPVTGTCSSVMHPGSVAVGQPIAYMWAWVLTMPKVNAQESPRRCLGCALPVDQPLIIRCQTFAVSAWAKQGHVPSMCGAACKPATPRRGWVQQHAPLMTLAMQGMAVVPVHGWNLTLHFLSDQQGCLLVRYRRPA